MKPAFMVVHKQLKPLLGKTCRSGFYPLISPAFHFRPEPTTGSDVMGSVAVLSLWAGMLMLMRLLLAT